jgi:hypothetical protein
MMSPNVPTDAAAVVMAVDTVAAAEIATKFQTVDSI